MRWRGRRWNPDKQGLIKAAVGLVAAATGTALPLGAAADAVFALARLGEPDIEAWHDRLVERVRRWAHEHPDIVRDMGELPTGWDQQLLEQLGKVDAANLLGSDKRTRESVEEILAGSVFTPLIGTDEGWKASRMAARKLLDDLPQLVVEAAPSDPGLMALRKVLEGDLGEVLDRLPPKPADRTALEAYLTALVDELDQDPWTRFAGGRASSVTSIARRLEVHARADTGYGAKQQESKEVDDADHLVGRCERLVVVGGPGAGKTWLARRSAINAAKAGLEAFAGEADPASVELPMFARLAAVLGSDADAWEAAVTAALAQVAHRLGPGRVSEALRRRFLEEPGGRYLVVLDGLDEVEHLPAGDLLDRLATTAGRELRIVLTTRPSSWRRQLPLDEQNQRHRLAELQPLRYPEDVTAVIGTWLTDRPDARDQLTTLLERRTDLAEMATTPLLCAMYCLLAGTGDPLPQTRRKLHEQIVTRLLQGTWHLQQLTGPQQAAARAALLELAWAGAIDDPATGLGAWSEDVRPELDVTLSEPVFAAISHIAPAVEYHPDVAVPSRRFIHRSIREYLVAEHLATLPADSAMALIEPHLWYDRDWEEVLPAAIAGHPQRDALLRALLVGDKRGSVTWQAVNRRDGFGELRRLLAQLATETSPGDWSKEHTALINGVCSGLTAAAMGWPKARPGPSHLARLQAGEVPWPEETLRDWIGYLELTPATRPKLVQSLADLLSAGQQLDGAVGVAIALDALGPTQQQRAAAIKGLTNRLRGHATLKDARAFRALASGPAPDELAQAVQGQFDSVDDDLAPDGRAIQLTQILDELGVEPAVRHLAVGLLVDRLATLSSRPPELVSPETRRGQLVEAIARGGPDEEQRARTIDLLLGQLADSDSWHTRQLMRQIGELLPTGPNAGVVLRHLMESGGPWERTGEAGEVLGRLATAASDHDRHAAAAAVHQRIQDATGWSLLQWVEHLSALRPTVEERTAAVEHFLGRLPETPINSIGFVTSPIRTLGPNQEQRGRLVRHLVNELSSVDHASWLCEMVSWFSPEGEARSATLTALIASAASLQATDYRSLARVAAGLQFADDERRQLVDGLIGKLGTGSPLDALTLAEVMVQLRPTSKQRSTAVRLLLARLADADTVNDLDVLVQALRTVEAAEKWRASASGIVLPALLDASPDEVRYRAWQPLLPELVPAPDDRRRLVAAFIPNLQPDNISDVLQLLDSLQPTGAQEEAITARLVTVLASARLYEAVGVAEALAARELRAEQRRAVVENLLERLDTTNQAGRRELLQSVARLRPDDGQRRAAAIAALRYSEGGGWSASSIVEMLVELGGLDEENRRRAVGIALGRLVADHSLHVTEPESTALLRLGFDAAALGDFAGRHPDAWILRDLADALRHDMDAIGWLAALASLADFHPTLYAQNAP